MKPFLIALVAALLLATQVLTPAHAEAAAAPTAATCGNTYTVQRGDYLSKIANYCGVSLSTLITANPEITNINRIYPGQVIRLVIDSSIPVTSGPTYRVAIGDTLYKIAVRYGTTVLELMRLNPSITDPTLIYVGQVIYLPGSTTGNTGNTGSASLTLSTRSVKAGNSVQVWVYGFPANASIDFRAGKSGQVYSVVVDGKTDANGYATAKVTIPSSATAGNLWTIRVTTTDRAKGVEIVSPTITITQ